MRSLSLSFTSSFNCYLSLIFTLTSSLNTHSPFSPLTHITFSHFEAATQREAFARFHEIGDFASCTHTVTCCRALLHLQMPCAGCTGNQSCLSSPLVASSRKMHNPWASRQSTRMLMLVCCFPQALYTSEEGRGMDNR